MFEYLKGKVISIYNSYVVVDICGIGFKVYFINNSLLKKNSENLIYIYHHVSENQSILFGFLDPDIKNLFSSLIKVKNIGVKTAYLILNKYDINFLYELVENNDELLLKIPKVNKTNIEQFKKAILKNKGSRIDIDILNSEIVILLRNLDYKIEDILKIYDKIDKDKNINDQLKIALKFLDGGI